MNELVPVKGRRGVVPSKKQPKIEIPQVDGLSTGPSEIGASQITMRR